jgi:uncharacterized damage-inducible protein DinB
MNLPQYFVQRWETEQRAFAKVLRAIPNQQLDYRPHERSNSAGDLAWQLAGEQAHLSQLIDTGEIHAEQSKRPATLDEIIAAWERATEQLRERLGTLDEAMWDKPATFYWAGQPVWKENLGGILFGYLFDMVHHRGQLSAYLRPMGAKVPAIYGPSGDEQG